MTFDRLRRPAPDAASGGSAIATPGKRTLFDQTFGRATSSSASPLVQRKAADGAQPVPFSFSTIPIHSPDAAPSTPGEAAFGAATSGAAAEVPHRAEMESRFGADFSGVRAHVGQDAALGAVGARGAARGDEVAFASATPDRSLVAHELAHVEQQRRAGTASVAASRAESRPSDAPEREADAIGDAVARGARHVEVAAAPSAGLHFDKGKDAASAEPMIPLTVRVFMKGRDMFSWHGLSPEMAFDGVRFTARNDGSGWSWSDSEGANVLLHEHKGDKGRTVERFLADKGLNKHGAYLIVVDFGTVSTPIDSGTGATEDDDAPSAKASGGDRSSSPSNAKHVDGGKPSAQTATGTGTSSDASKDGDWQQLPGVQDTLKQLGQSPDASSSKGRSATSDDDGASDGTQDNGVGTGTGEIANARGGGGQWSNIDNGGKDGQADGSDKRSLVHNENAEKGDAGDNNIPEDGAKADGRAGGEADKGSGGAAGGGALWKLISVPAAIGVVVDLGIILKQADLAGLSDGLVSKAMLGLRGKALKAMIESDIDRFAMREVATLDTELEKIPDWEYLSDAAKASKRAQMKYAIKDSIARSVANDLDQRIKELESTLKTAPSDVEKGEVAAESATAAEAELKAANRTREALKDFGPKQGAGSFRDLEERTGKSAAKDAASEAETADQAFVRTRSYWTTTSEFRGMKVYERNDLINPELVAEGETNVQRMERGVAPYGPDGKPMELHHLNQANEGPVIEITNTFHRENSAVIHINPSSTPSGIDRAAFDAWKAQYWRYRASVLKGG